MKAGTIAGTLFAIGGLMHAQQLTPHQHRKVAFRSLHSDGTAEAYNWAGYAIAAWTPPATATTPTGVTVTSVSGSWVVPAVTCSGGGRGRSSSSQYAAFWIGIDGWYSDTVEQVGTDSDCSSGTPSYYAWYEFYPLNSYLACPPTTTGHHQQAPPCPLSNLSPGDVISASVVANANGTFTATISAATKSGSSIGSFSTVYTPNSTTGTPQLSSAEWIAEAPCCTNKGGTLPLADFGSMTFTNAEATVNGQQAALITLPSTSTTLPDWWVCTMVDQNYSIPDGGVNPTPYPPPAPDLMAQPGALGATTSDPTYFSVQWSSDGP